MLPLLAGAPGSAPVNRLAQQVARVLNAPQLPQMNFAPASVPPTVAARAQRARPMVVPPVIAGPALPLAESMPPVVESAPPAQTVVVTQLRAAPPTLEDETVCRKGQFIPGSRLLGPSVCLKASAWAELAAQGRDIGPDGRSIVASANSFEKRASINPASCIRAANNSASGGGMLPRIACF
jgi:hypothetical protein